ncbi:MAG TPA: thiamine phosphate synthase [Bacteroidales bacterium]|nr:thiamine phosphate synthase [Bacteroidales bacterium]
MLPKLYYITQPLPGISYTSQVDQVCRGGVQLVQLRLKDVSKDEVLRIAGEVKQVTDSYGAKLVINDCPEIAVQVNACGVHLGMNDMHPREARTFLGNSILIGGTANTFERVAELFPYVDYFGIGPFRFTETKKNLAPILGIGGYTAILQKMQHYNMYKPVYAIGGIEENDFPALMKTGIHGIAVSSLIAKSTDAVQTIKALNALLNK